MVGTLMDVTAQRQTEAALRDKHAAEMASRAKSAFLSRMSHEMRTTAQTPSSGSRSCC
jgi:signal transduction histidine kinase